MDLRGKRAFLTGAARGIGKEIALALADEGCALLLSDLSEATLEDTAAACRARGVAVETLVLDVTDAAAVAGLREGCGEIDVLVNNAGVVHGGAFRDVPMQDHAHTARVNFEGLMGVTHALLPILVGRPRAMIVNLASAAGFVGLPLGSSYAASKWAVLGFGESLRLELAGLGHRHVKLLHVCPGYVDTGLFEGARAVRLTHLLTARRLARRVVAAMRREKLWLRTPWLIALTPFFRALLPTRAGDVVLRWFGATTSLAHWRGRAG